MITTTVNKTVRAPATGAGDLGPGTYDGGSSFTKTSKGYSFGKPKPEKKIVDNRDYGYDPDKEFK